MRRDTRDLPKKGTIRRGDIFMIKPINVLKREGFHWNDTRLSMYYTLMHRGLPYKRPLPAKLCGKMVKVHADPITVEATDGSWVIYRVRVSSSEFGYTDIDVAFLTSATRNVSPDIKFFRHESI